MQFRSELQQERLVVQRRQMELLTAKNSLMPQLDLVSIYRVRGLDQQLAGNNSAFRQLGDFDPNEPLAKHPSVKTDVPGNVSDDSDANGG